MLIEHRSRLLALPTCLHGIISKQRTNTERMRVEIRAIMEEILLSSPEDRCVSTEDDGTTGSTTGSITDSTIGSTTGSDTAVQHLILGAINYKSITPYSFQYHVINHLSCDDVGRRGWRQRPETTEDWYHRLLDFYLVHNKDKIMNLPDLLQQFQGKEQKLVQKIEQKYKPMRVHGTWRNRARQCLATSAEEIVTHLLGTPNESSEEGSNVKYFVIDCRSENETKCGKFGSAFWMDPTILQAGEEERSKVLESLEALRGQVSFSFNIIFTFSIPAAFHVSLW